MKRLTPIKAIRAFCLECCGTSKEVDLCTANPRDISLAAQAGDEAEYQGCPLYDYRKGHRPLRIDDKAQEGSPIPVQPGKAAGGEERPLKPPFGRR
jgi:hypothetical protein